MTIISLMKVVDFYSVICELYLIELCVHNVLTTCHGTDQSEIGCFNFPEPFLRLKTYLIFLKLILVHFQIRRTTFIRIVLNFVHTKQIYHDFDTNNGPSCLTRYQNFL